MRENFLKMLMGTQLRIYIVHHVWTLERRYRGLDDLDACYFSDIVYKAIQHQPEDQCKITIVFLAL
jgi:hypothetical protein